MAVQLHNSLNRLQRRLQYKPPHQAVGAGRLLCLLPLLLCCLPGPAASSAPQPELLPVDEAFAVTVQSGADDQLEASFIIAPDHYLYKSSFTLSFDSTLAPFEVSGQPVEVRDDYFGLTLVYFEQAALLVRPKPGADRLVVKFQGCAKDRYCYPPTRRTFNIEGFMGGVLRPEETEPSVRNQPLF